jgi:hypothetical protein
MTACAKYCHVFRGVSVHSHSLPGYSSDQRHNGPHFLDRIEPYARMIGRCDAKPTRIQAQRFSMSDTSRLICNKRPFPKAKADFSSAVCWLLLQYRAVVTLRSLISCLMLVRRSEIWFASIITLISSQFQAARFWEAFVVSCPHLTAIPSEGS